MKMSPSLTCTGCNLVIDNDCDYSIVDGQPMHRPCAERYVTNVAFAAVWEGVNALDVRVNALEARVNELIARVPRLYAEASAKKEE